MLKINNGKIYQQWTKSRIVFSEEIYTDILKVKKETMLLYNQQKN